MCQKIEKQAKSSFTTCRVRLIILCLVGHIADKGVTWRRVALTKKRGKTQKMRGSEGKILEKRWKKRREEGKVWKEGKKKNGEKGEREEKGGRKKRYRKRRWDNACHVPSTFAQKATMFEPPRKNIKNAGNTRNMQIWAERTLVRHHKPTKMAPPQAQKATDAHCCPKNEQKCHKTPSPLSSTPRKCHEPHQKRQIDVQNSQKIPQKQKKTIWCPKLTKRGSYLGEKFEQARIKDFI